MEAKKAVPRDDHQNFNRNNGSIQGSPGPVRTKKIFVGGLASTVTESDFKRYFDQFGTITDVVVMYDHNTQRPRGFGFITYDSEESVDKVLVKTFHELNGKAVEVKRAVPKELSPGPSRSPSGGYNNHGLNRAGSFLNAYSPTHSFNTGGGYGMRIDGRFSPVTVGRSGYPPYSPSNQSMRLNFDSGFGLNYGGNRDSVLGYGNGMNSYFSGNSSGHGSPVSHNVGSSGTASFLNTTNRDPWANGISNYATKSMTSHDFLGSGTGNAGAIGSFGIVGESWGSSSVSANGGRDGFLNSGNIVYGNRDNNLIGRTSYIRNDGEIDGSASLYSFNRTVGDSGFGNLYGRDSFYTDHAWDSSSPKFEHSSGSFGYGLESAAADVTSDNSVGYSGGYSVTARSNRGKHFINLFQVFLSTFDLLSLKPCFRLIGKISMIS